MCACFALSVRSGADVLVIRFVCVCWLAFVGVCLCFVCWFGGGVCVVLFVCMFECAFWLAVF